MNLSYFDIPVFSGNVLCRTSEKIEYRIICIIFSAVTEHVAKNRNTTENRGYFRMFLFSYLRVYSIIRVTVRASPVSMSCLPCFSRKAFRHGYSCL